MNTISRIIAGAAGGLIASASKILAMDVEKLGQFMNNGDANGFNELTVTIYIFTPILVTLGAIIAWASQEENKMKAIAIGCAAPALIAPWTSGSLSNTPSINIASIVTPAYAEDVKSYEIAESNYIKGLKGVLGLTGVEDRRYWVIAGSKKDISEAKSYAKSINAIDPSIQAFVGQKQPDNDFYPIIVGGVNSYLSLKDAKALKKRATKISIVPHDAYLSDFPDRLPAIK